jgi:hypothetical protein
LSDFLILGFNWKWIFFQRFLKAERNCLCWKSPTYNAPTVALMLIICMGILVIRKEDIFASFVNASLLPHPNEEA